MAITETHSADGGHEGRRLSDALSHLIRVLQFRDRDRACCHGLSVSQCYALEAIVSGGESTVNDIAARLYLDKSTTSRVVNGLVSRGLAERARDPEDGRVVLLRATPEGVQVEDRIQADLEAEYEALLGAFEPEVREASIDLVARLADLFAKRVDASGGSCCVVPFEPRAEPEGVATS